VHSEKGKFRSKLLTVTICILIVTACKPDTGTFVTASTYSSERLTPITVLPIQDFLNNATRKSKEWNNNAYLVWAICNISGPNQELPPETYFRFESSDEEDVILNISCFASGCSTQVFPVSRKSGWAPIEFTENMIDCPAAAKISQAYGGEGFVRSSRSMMWLKLQREDPMDLRSRMIWLAAYSTEVDYLIVILDAVTGEVISSK
jgi:hypothetical protein